MVTDWRKGKLRIVRRLSENLRDCVYCVSYEWKRDKLTVLSYNMISYAYITVILAFSNHYIISFLTHALVYISFLGRSAMSTEDGKSHTRIFEWHKGFREGHEDIKDESKSGRSLTSRTGVNIEWVKQVVCGDRRLTVQLIASQ